MRPSLRSWFLLGGRQMYVGGARYDGSRRGSNQFEGDSLAAGERDSLQSNVVGACHVVEEATHAADFRLMRAFSLLRLGLHCLLLQ